MEVYKSKVDPRYSVVTIGKRSGIMNEQGTIIVPCIYHYINIESVEDGVIRTEVRHKPHEFLHFTEQGKRIEPPKHVSYYYGFEEGRLMIGNKQNLWGFVDKEGTVVMDCQYEGATAFEEGSSMVKFKGKWGLIDTFGKMIIPFRYDNILKTGSEQFVAQRGEKWGFMRLKTGKIVQWRYDNIINIGNDRWMGKRFNRWALLTNMGRELTGFDFDTIEHGYQKTPNLLVQQGNFYGLISQETGGIVLPVAYQEIRQGINKHYSAVRQLDQWGFIHCNTATLIIDCQYDTFELFYYSLFIAVQSGEKWGLLNEQLISIMPLKYDKIEYIFEQIVRLQSGGKWAIGNLSGQQLSDFQYDTVVHFMENLLKVQIGHKFGVIDMQGNIVIGIRYHEIHRFVEDMARVDWGRHISRTGFVNRQGEEVIPPIYDHAYDFSEGLALVCHSGNGFIDKQGNVIIPFIYWEDCVSSFKQGLAIAGFRYPRKMGMINRNNEIIIPFEYTMVWGIGADGFILAEQGDKSFFFDINGVLQPDHVRDYGEDDNDTIEDEEEDEDEDND